MAALIEYVVSELPLSETFVMMAPGHTECHSCCCCTWRAEMSANISPPCPPGGAAPHVPASAAGTRAQARPRRHAQKPDQRRQRRGRRHQCNAAPFAQRGVGVRQRRARCRPRRRGRAPPATAAALPPATQVAPAGAQGAAAREARQHRGLARTVQPCLGRPRRRHATCAPRPQPADQPADSPQRHHLRRSATRCWAREQTARPGAAV